MRRRRSHLRDEPDVWYHGSPHRFEQFRSSVGRRFGSGASEVPLFLTRDLKFATLYAGASGYIYEVRPHVERTFDARTFVLDERYWPPPRDALTPEGQKFFDDLVENRIFPELIRYGTKHEDEDEWRSMHDSQGTYASIFARNYDVLETTEMKRWLRAHGYDSFLVSGDGPEDNLAVFDPERIEILSTRPVESLASQTVRETTADLPDAAARQKTEQQRRVAHAHGYRSTEEHRRSKEYIRFQPEGMPLLGWTSEASDSSLPDGFVFAYTNLAEPLWGGWSPFAYGMPEGVDVLTFTGTDEYDPGDAEGVAVRPQRLLRRESPRAWLARIAKSAKDPEYREAATKILAQHGHTLDESRGDHGAAEWRVLRETSSPLPDASICIIFDDHGRVLTVSRPEPPHEQSIPGGVVDTGENPVQAAVRELREECAVDPRDPVHAAVVRSPTDGRRVHVFVASGCRGTARAAEPGTRVTWLTPKQLLAQARLYRSTVHELMTAGVLGDR